MRTITIIILIAAAFMLAGCADNISGDAKKKPGFEMPKPSLSACEDSDGGKMPYIFGAVGYNGKKYQDVCASEEAVIEMFCKNNGKPGKTLIDCYDGYTCDAGVCKPAYSCFDSDDGVNPLVFGTVTGSKIGIEYYESDVCTSGTSVKEWYCDDGKPISTNEICPANHECDGGACVEVTSVAFCNDTDGGSVPEVWGECFDNTGGTQYMEDNCVGNTLNEAVCMPTSASDNECGMTQIVCEGACSNGVCVPTGPVGCGDTIYGDTTLTEDLECLSFGLIVTNGATLDCDGHYLTKIGAYTGAGVSIMHTDGAQVKNCLLYNFTTGIGIFNSTNNQVYDNEIYSSTIGGIRVNYYSVGNMITGNYLSGNKWGIYTVNDANSNTITNNVIEYSTLAGLSFDTPDNYVAFNTVCNNPVDIQGNSALVNTGINNTCDVVVNWDDVGTTGCMFAC